MAKRISTTRQKKTPATRSTARTPSTGTASATERQILAFAEQLGYVAGSIQSKAGGMIDRETLSRQVTGVRDGAKQLLAQLAAGVATRVRRKAPAPKRIARKGRSGGMVDAPGKKHRKPAPAGPADAVTRAQEAKLRTASPMAKTFRHRARG